MKNVFYLLLVLLTLGSGVAIGKLSRLNIDGTWYTDGQTAYIDCSKSTVGIYIDVVVGGDPNAPSIVPLYAETSSNFSTTDTQSSIQKILNLDQNRQDGFVKASVNGNFNSGSYIIIYVTQKPPTLSFTASPILCSSGNSATYSVVSDYNFQSARPIDIIWQTTGGVTVNGGNTYTANSTVSSSVTIQYNSFGSVRVYAVIPGCGNLQSGARSLYVGIPASGEIGFRRSGGPEPSSSLCSGSYYNFVSVPELSPSQYSYSWSIPTGSNSVSYFYSFGTNATIGAGSAGGGFVLQMSVTQSGCSGTGGASRTFFINNCGSFRVAQNPTTNQITVLFDAEYDSKKLPDKFVLSNEKNGPVEEKKVKGEYSDVAVKSGLSIDIDVHTLPRGTYYLKSIYGSDKPDVSESVRVILE